ncbi:preprotein translocase subunit SecE [Chitinilyticum piscinae]|uniref:Protein translocase subunit SecE n=1 Tax=Chitinilyticum piscinae TaxID=2866724 RepID=A0A8J7K1A8_9NEIS|nr:preprotein translocase subunit SecE [Chitinilyticum piscinae]MBE9608966.1 preprotein translocase subunit SecE [Chitinilyticum piscinae]
MESVDKIKVAVAVLLLLAGAVAYQFVPAVNGAARVGMLLASMLAAFAVFWVTALRRDFVDYARDAWKEAKKVVWPSKKETWQTTLVVFAFVGVLALFMLIVDKGLTWVFYELILGRK